MARASGMFGRIAPWLVGRFGVKAGVPSQAALFQKIYRNKGWGQSDNRYFSGTGSHDPNIVQPYVQALRDWCAQFENKLNAVDLGCGDFAVGAQIRPLFDSFTACDLVPELIRHNSKTYVARDVDFRVLDMTRDALPKGDVALVRQVLQHMSNDLIQVVLPKLAGSYRYLVLTEHLPDGTDFVPNLDCPRPGAYRLGIQSGVVLTAPPFNFQVLDQNVLCEARELGGVIRTTAYRLA